MPPALAALTRLTRQAPSRRGALRTGLGMALPLLSGSVSACAGALTGAFPTTRRPVAPTPTPPRRAPLQAPLTYVAIGASDAEAFGIATPRRDGWVPVLARELPQPARLVNLGVGGITLRQAVEGVLPRAVETQPDLVTVWLVVNDVLGGVALDQYQADLNRLLGALRTQTKAVVAVGNVPYPPARLDPWGLPDIVRRTMAGRWNGVIAAAAKTHGAIVVDLFTRWPLAEHPEFIGSDGLHPTVAGHHALAATFLQVLREERAI